jgi:predicted secreted hydrolase
MRRSVALSLAAVLVTGCGGAPILANPPLTFPTPAVTPAPSARPADPIPLAFPRDDGPHDRLTEWWYYTGHLKTGTGRRFGFEAVVFRAERSSVPTAWAAHLALTDEQNDRFVYAQRSEIGPQVDQSPRDDAGAATGFGLGVAGLSPTLIAAGASPFAEPWRFTGSNGSDAVEAVVTPEEAAAAGGSFGIDLQLGPGEPVPHDGDGFVEFGPAGSSYYYSRMRMPASGTVQLDDVAHDVTGTAWFDHQWGDFISVGGGWDWFAVNLEDGTDLTLSIVRDGEGNPVLEYGTLDEGRGLVEGPAVNLTAEAFAVETLGSWASPRTGRTWPSGWRLTVGEFEITLEPTVDDQELDTRATTGVVYWEGSQVVTATRNGVPLGGEAYVELTRYAD